LGKSSRTAFFILKFPMNSKIKNAVRADAIEILCLKTKYLNFFKTYF